MGIFKTLRKRRAKKRLRSKTAKLSSRQSGKLALKRDKLLAKQERHLAKAERKGLKAKRKHEHKLAKTELARRKAGRFNKDKVLRYSSAARTVAPFLLPLLYRGLTFLRAQLEGNKARRLGVSADELAQFSGYGAPLKARISGMRNSVRISSLSTGFIQDVEDRLEELDASVDNAERMTPEQRVRAHRKITKELDQLASQIQDKLS